MITEMFTAKKEIIQIQGMFIREPAKSAGDAEQWLKKSLLAAEGRIIVRNARKIRGGGDS